ncbi:unnamed protein product [Parascedosporium putredinis]|uniref:Peptidase S33 tripeptidyl aminopeptidase-like C-terminal domain-containing protein n=1 Tax=Parascedosporium putredinis TaxID=1442378 RepID=A0A9P1GYS5_9PEZI|nr:unnamed protein product [Parascedosporium putredinis]CAI7990206.1 unnamed protein product [Parascedosporium putredinis]
MKNLGRASLLVGLSTLASCSKLNVPLDYTDKSSNKTLELDLIKYPAQNGPSQGSILLNFGGPGQDGLNSMVAYAPIQAPITGGQFDLISWDPRGTGNTLRFACFEPEEIGTQYAQGVPDASDTAPGQVWAEAQILAKTCGETQKANGGLVGMAFTSRDMIEIVDALEEDGLLRYWGLSGGTALGATVAAMFPERVDKIILDGVMNSHQYYHSFGNPAPRLQRRDLRRLPRRLRRHPQQVPLGTRFDTADELKSAIADFFEDLNIANTLTLSTLYRPNSYQNLSRVIDGLLDGDTSPVADVFFGPGAAALSDLDAIEEEFRQESKLFPGFARGYYVYACALWPFEAKERYEGDFHVKTKNPLLFIGNTYDPVTPLASAKNMSAGFEGSVVLQHNGFGPSNCTIKAIQKYFASGELPEADTVCEPNLPLFAEDPEI